MYNYEVRAATTAKQALELASHYKFDSMLFLLELPGGGFALSQQIRKLEGCLDTPIAYSTEGDLDNALMMESQFYGGQFLFHKPFQEVELLTQLSSMVRIKQLQDELKTKVVELDKLASTDPLTGLYNRRLFFQRLDEEVSRAVRHVSPITLVFLDIDLFKEVNDNYGHQAGDLVLKQLAIIMTRLLRASDVLGRVGGEEFMILLPDTPAKPGLEVAQRLRKKVEESTFSYSGQTIQLTISAGVYHVSNPKALEVDELVKRADNALLEAKNSGRNHVVFYNSEDAATTAPAD